MKIKRFHWNVTILALFILLACSLCWVLVALYMKNFIKYSEEISSYEKTNYLAKAGIELGLAIVWSRNVWVDFKVDTWEAVDNFMDNFVCTFPLDDDGKCPQQPKFSMIISWLANSYNWCDAWTLYEVKPGLSVVIPLFKDQWLTNNSFDWILNQWEKNDRGTEHLSAIWDSSNRKFWLVWTDESTNTLKIDQWDGALSSLRVTPNTLIWAIRHWYLIIANPDKTVSKQICINWKDIPQETVNIVSVGYYNWRQLWTETLATKALPDFLQGDNYLVN